MRCFRLRLDLQRHRFFIFRHSRHRRLSHVHRSGCCNRRHSMTDAFFQRLNPACKRVISCSVHRTQTNHAELCFHTPIACGLHTPNGILQNTAICNQLCCGKPFSQCTKLCDGIGGRNQAGGIFVCCFDQQHVPNQAQKLIHYRSEVASGFIRLPNLTDSC